VEISRVLEMLARTDASVAWTVMVALGFNFVYSRFSPQIVEQVRAVSPSLLTRGAVAPQGRAIPVEGGYRVEGRWALGSGSYDYRFVMATCLIMDGDKPAVGADDTPITRVALLPASAVEFLDTWKSVGLCATNSHDFAVKSVFVPEEWTTSLSGPDHFKLPLTGFDFLMASTPNHASVSVGITQGILDDILTLSLKKRPTRGGGKTLATDPLFAYELGHLSVRLEALRALLEARLVESAALARKGDPVGALEVAKVCATASYVQHECQDIANQAFTLGGATVCYLSTSLQRRWRDIRCVVQHIAASRAKYQAYGNALIAHAQALG
jgi:indole-3-acetate monooxygenase